MQRKRLQLDAGSRRVEKRREGERSSARTGFKWVGRLAEGGAVRLAEGSGERWTRRRLGGGTVGCGWWAVGGG
jgi:hypothetical protein